MNASVSTLIRPQPAPRWQRPEVASQRLRRPRFAVIGAGNGGLAVAAHLCQHGFAACLYNRSDNRLRPLQETGGILVRAGAGQQAPLAFIPLTGLTAQLDQALAAADILMVVVPATAHAPLARAMAPLLRDGQIIVLNPGRTGGALEFRRTLQEAGCNVRVTVAEAQTLLYACRNTGPAEVTVYSTKRRVPLAALPAHETPRVLAWLRRAFPQFDAAPHVLATSLDNIGAVFHPVPLLLNVGRVEAGQPFEFYHGAVTPSVARVMEAVDAERLRVAEAWGVPLESAVEWLQRSYGAPGGSLYHAIHHTAAYAGIVAPDSVQTRYLFEDIPTSLVPLSELGRAVGVATPQVDALISLASAVHGVDYRASGRTLERLGLEGRRVQEVLHYVREGSWLT